MSTTQLELNKRYTMKELTELIPNMWVFLSDAEYDEHGWATSGILLDYTSFEQREAVHKKLVAAGITDYVCERTTEAEPFMGVLFL